MSLNGIFNGRVGRQDFALFHLIAVGALLALFAAQRVIVLFVYPETTEGGLAATLDLVLVLLSASSLLLGAFVIAAIIVLSVRRLHDVGYPGAIVLGLIALWILSPVSIWAAAVGMLGQFFLLIMEGDPGRNRYGDRPSGGLFNARNSNVVSGRFR